MAKKLSITQQQYGTLDQAYAFFNAKLFGNALPECMIVLQRKGKNNLGYFHPERFFERYNNTGKGKKSKVKTVSELSLNPDNFVGRSDAHILSTLVHEMAHVWQFHCTDKYPSGGYHDKKWGAKMDELGLTPSNTGKPGGKRTGRQMTHFIVDGGAFDKACRSFLKSNRLHWTSALLPAQSSKRNKAKYTCPDCGMNAWAKPDINIVCGECNQQLEEV